MLGDAADVEAFAAVEHLVAAAADDALVRTNAFWNATAIDFRFRRFRKRLWGGLGS